ncbi:aminotransferase class V-fold PLP-dependent enzyme [Halovivax cerinus]|uniref:Aminotransferase class V-fold PLP-dependent enzyme n=1 Tax=Halovivax cerinus TaxID=1487865 RepID=A0ABD5NPN4_9EURY|nr:aminotransferase class V-fold PLP-dependent enzyme [Halovivax cerinus]
MGRPDSEGGNRSVTVPGRDRVLTDGGEPVGDASAKPLADYRETFPAIAEEDRIHLNNCSAAPVPQRGLDARRECERIWIEAGNPWGQWMSAVEESKALFAELINADPDEIAVVASATQALAQVASALSYDDSDEIVTTDLEFPTVPQFWHAQERRGANRIVVESDDGLRVSADEYARAMSDDTLLVSTAHAFSFTGGLMDPKAVADAVHDRGGYLFLDAYQSMGIVPIDVEEQDIDMLVSGNLKFLLGGPGIAFLYVDDAVANDLVPTNMGWFGTDDIFGFETDDPSFADGARRFELGTPPAPNAYTAAAGMELILEVGVDRIRERSLELTGALIDLAEDAGFEVRTPHKDAHRGGVVNVQVADPDAAADALIEDGFNVSTRGGGVRLSPHFYNTDAEMEAAIEALAEHATPR